jgi:hypothetical protein
LPRVRYWQVGNEPNISLDLTPQLLNGRPVTPRAYRDMVNRSAASIKRVHPDNVVVAGGLAPFFDRTPYVTEQDPDWGPLTFMRQLLCLSRSLRPTCAHRVRFDVWSTHPYTSGGPTHKAYLPDDVSLGDLGEMRAVLNAAVRTGHVQSRNRVRFWVTEFSWDSKPPDPRGVPTSLLTRWVPHALYEMWRNGVSLVTWYQVRDEPLDKSPCSRACTTATGTRSRPSRDSASHSSPSRVATARTSGAGLRRPNGLAWSSSSGPPRAGRRSPC